MDAQQIEAKLTDLDFFIHSVTKIDYGLQLRLGCGAVINVYDKGAVLVQGKLIPECREQSLTKLKQALPPDTRWCVK
jgi:hypothetical protein